MTLAGICGSKALRGLCGGCSRSEARISAEQTSLVGRIGEAHQGATFPVLDCLLVSAGNAGRKQFRVGTDLELGGSDQTSLGMRCGTQNTSGHDVVRVYKGSTWYMADGFMTSGHARPLRAPSLGTGGGGELHQAADGDTLVLIYTRKLDSAIQPGGSGGARG